MAEARRTFSLDGVHEFIVALVLLRIPPLSLHLARQVSSKWKAIVDSAWFQGQIDWSAISGVESMFYRPNSTREDLTLYCLVDRGKEQIVTYNIVFSGTCPRTQRRVAVRGGQRQLYVWKPTCVKFGNWVRFPAPPNFDWGNTRARGMGMVVVGDERDMDRYKILRWTGQGLWYLDSPQQQQQQQQAWICRDEERPNLSNGVLIKDKIYAVDCDNKKLYEYDWERDMLASRPISGGVEEDLDLSLEVYVCAWKDDIYVLGAIQEDEHEHACYGFRMWRISASHATATLVVSHEFEHPVFNDGLRAQLGLEDGTLIMVAPYLEEGRDILWMCWDLSAGTIKASRDFIGGQVDLRL